MDKRNAVVADVYTDPKGQKVLKEAIGNSFIIYAIVPDQNGNLRVVSGATYSYYEFSESSSNRLTDESWQALLDSKTPSLPSWVTNSIPILGTK